MSLTDALEIEGRRLALVIDVDDLRAPVADRHGVEAACFALCIMPDFPSRSLPGYDVIPPEVWQCVIVHYVFDSFYFILTSRVHRFNEKSLIHTCYICCFRYPSPLHLPPNVGHWSPAT